MEPQSRTIEDLRAEIDEADDGLIKLLSKRIDLTRQVAFIKIAAGNTISDTAREAQILARIANHPHPILVAVAMRRIISTCRTMMYDLEFHAKEHNRG